MIRAAAIGVLLTWGCSAPEPTRFEQIRTFIQSPGNERESVLWLRALGVAEIAAPCEEKFANLLQRTSRDSKGMCNFRIDGPFADAVLVSRSRRQALPEIRSLLDVEAIEDYVLWSERPERVGFSRTEEGLRIDADTGPNDLVLVRVPFADGWTADVEIAEDPIGYVLLTPAHEGRQTFTLRPDSSNSTNQEQWMLTPFPRIHPEGVDQPGQRYLVIFGERFMPGLTNAVVDGVRVPGVFSNKNQLNVQLPESIAPGAHELRVEAPAGLSHPVTIEVGP